MAFIQPESDNTGGALKGITFVGTEASGTFVTVELDESTYHQIDNDSGNIDIVYKFCVGNKRKARDLIAKGYLDAASGTGTVYAYDFEGTAFEKIDSLAGTNGAENTNKVLQFLPRHTGTGAERGDVYIRFETVSQTNADLFVGILLIDAEAEDLSGFTHGSVWVDTINGISGTASGTGEQTLPVDNLADAYTIAIANNLRMFSIEPGSSITLPADSSKRTFEGKQYNVALNSANIDSSTFTGASVISGIATADSGNGPSFFTCGIDTVTLPPCNGFQCGLFGTFTMGSEGSYTFGGSATVFNLPSIIDYGAGNNASQFFLQSWGGGAVEIQNAGAGTGNYVFDMHGLGGLTINANCSATTSVELHGHILLTNNASGISVSQDANYTGTSAHLAITQSAMTESYAAQGVVPTLEQAIMWLYQQANDSLIVGTTWTIKELDQSSVAGTVTLDNGTNPTSVTRNV